MGLDGNFGRLAWRAAFVANMEQTEYPSASALQLMHKLHEAAIDGYGRGGKGSKCSKTCLKNELNSACQRLAGKSMNKGDIVYTTTEFSWQYQATVTVNCFDAIGEQVFAGELKHSPKEAEQSAAYMAALILKEQIPEPLPQAAKRPSDAADGPNAKVARGEEGIEFSDEPIDPATKARLYTAISQICGRELSDGDIQYDVAAVEGGGFQGSVKAPCLPGALASTIWTGAVTPAKQAAKISAASRAIEALINNADVGAKVDLSQSLEHRAFLPPGPHKASKGKAMLGKVGKGGLKMAGKTMGKGCPAAGNGEDWTRDWNKAIETGMWDKMLVMMDSILTIKGKSRGTTGNDIGSCAGNAIGDVTGMGVDGCVRADGRGGMGDWMNDGVGRGGTGLEVCIGKGTTACSGKGADGGVAMTMDGCVGIGGCGTGACNSKAVGMDGCTGMSGWSGEGLCACPGVDVRVGMSGWNGKGAEGGMAMGVGAYAGTGGWRCNGAEGGKGMVVGIATDCCPGMGAWSGKGACGGMGPSMDGCVSAGGWKYKGACDGMASGMGTDSCRGRGVDDGWPKWGGGDGCGGNCADAAWGRWGGNDGCGGNCADAAWSSWGGKGVGGKICGHTGDGVW